LFFIRGIATPSVGDTNEMLHAHVHARFIRGLQLISCLSTVLLIGALSAQEVAWSVKVVTDREDAVYNAGDTATFLITVSRGDEQVSGEGTPPVRRPAVMLPTAK